MTTPVHTWGWGVDILHSMAQHEDPAATGTHVGKHVPSSHNTSVLPPNQICIRYPKMSNILSDLDVTVVFNEARPPPELSNLALRCLYAGAFRSDLCAAFISGVTVPYLLAASPPAVPDPGSSLHGPARHHTGTDTHRPSPARQIGNDHFPHIKLGVDSTHALSPVRADHREGRHEEGGIGMAVPDLGEDGRGPGGGESSVPQG